jgi:ABC-type branched-subunit amino acid transport system substrate-binding protein
MSGVGGRHRRRRSTALALALCLTTACGSRLSSAERLAVSGQRGVTAGQASTPGAADTATDSGAVTGDGGSAAAPGSTGGVGTGPAAAGTGPAGAASAKAAPAGGNGGATDVGITGSEITVAVLSDRTGPVPGLFESSIRAVQAWANYSNSHGGIYGRKVKVVPIDSKTSTADNRAGALQACAQAFALVGSMSAYDDGGGPPVDSCGIPDIPVTVVNPGRENSRTTFPADPNVSSRSLLGTHKWLAEQFPDAPKASGELWLNAPVTRFNADKNMEATGAIGYSYVYRQQVEVVEPNFTRFVTDMKAANVQFVSMVSDNNSVARLLKAFQSQNYAPKVRQFDTVIYDQKFLSQAGPAAEGVYTFLNAVPLEEASSSKEYQLYIDTLKRSAGAAPDGFFGLYAWSAARLFQQAIENVGPQLTRAKVVAYLQGLHSWDGHGLHPAHDIGNKRIANCQVVLQVKGGKFVRAFPASGYDCDRVPVYTVKNAR